MSARDDLDDLPPEDADAALAAEFALRLLGPAEHYACLAREAEDPAFAALVARWREDFGAMDRDYPEVMPSAFVRRHLERRLFGVQPSALTRLWRSAGLWRGMTALAAGAALWLALPLIAPAPDDGQAPRLVSALAPATATGTTEFLAVYDPEDGALRLNHVAGAAPPGRSLELWVIAGEAAPVSLGVLTEGALSTIALPVELAGLIDAGAVLAVTDEPPGGAPGGVPTGTVQAAGPLRDI